MFRRTTAINKILALKERKKIIQGGTSAGKTYAIIPILIDKALKTPKLKITIVAETIPAVKDGAVDIFKNILHDTERWDDNCWIGNPLEYTFYNGSRIQFKAFDTQGKAKASGKRDILFLNEANHIPFPIADDLMIRSKQTYIDFNPVTEFWAHTEVMPEPNSCFLLLTYKDNEAIPHETLEDLLIKKGKGYYDVDGDLNDQSNIKNTYWANWWMVYGCGEIGNLEGVVLTDWDIVDNVPKEAQLLGYGMDFGFTNDPSSLMACYRYNDRIIWDELIYRKGMLNSDIAKEMKVLGVNGQIFADSAEPKSIMEIKLHGFMIRPVKKGKDSIMFGLSILQDKAFSVTSRSINTINELRNYLWDTDKEGRPINKPIDNFNHSIDSMRYFAMMKLGKPKLSKYMR